MDRYACLTVPVRDPQSVNICQVTARYSRAASTRRVRLSFYATPTSRSSLRRRHPYLTLSSKKEAFRHVQPPHFIPILSLYTPTCPNTAQQSPRNADTTRLRHRVRHRVTADIVSDTASDTPAIARHRYDRRSWRRGRIPTTPPRRLDTRRGLTPTPPLRRDGSRSSRDTLHATLSTLHLLSADKIC